MMRVRMLPRSLIRCGLLIFVAIVSSVSAPAQSSVEQITDVQASPSYEARHHLLHALEVDELKTGSEALFVFMQRVTPPEGMQVNDYLSLTNDIYDLFVRYGIASQRLLDYTLKTISDKEGNKVWRDYCVQKLSSALILENVSNESRQDGLLLLDQLTDGLNLRPRFGTPFD